VFLNDLSKNINFARVRKLEGRWCSHIGKGGTLETER